MEIVELNEYRTELKEKILACAAEEFRVHGVKAVRMDDIAKKLVISKRTLYEICKDKESLLLECMKSQMHKHHEYAIGLYESGKNPIEMLYDMMNLHTKVHKELNPVLFDEFGHYPSVQEYLAEVRTMQYENTKLFYKHGVDEGYFLPAICDEFVLSITRGVNDHITRMKLYNKYDIEKIYFHIVIMFIRGYCTQKGIQELDRLMKI